jgi:membrane associated rhomboid family serine protease
MIPVATNVERQNLPRATLILIGINTLVFIVELLLPDDALMMLVQNLGFGPASRNPVVPLTSMFLHGDIFHIAFNMLFLWVFGSPVEERVGSRNFLIYYFGAGIAAGFLNLIMEIIARPDSTIPMIGASGAISGIMALFLYRCFYSKMKLVVHIFLLPQQFNIPVIPLILFWFLKDVFFGIITMTHQSGVAHWAHVGGFIFGIVVGRIKRYGQDGQVEWMREKILKKLENGGGWKSAEKDLLKLLKVAPDDPEVQHDLARLYANNKNPKLSERHYRLAVQRYFLSDPVSAAYAVLEHLETDSGPMDIQYNLKASHALVEAQEFEDAHKVLRSVLKCDDTKGLLLERSLVLFIKLSQHLDKEDDANEGLKVLTAKFPDSKYMDDIENVMRMKPGEVFSSAGSAPGAAAPKRKTEEEKDAEKMGKIEFFERIFADPAFWSIMLFVNIFAFVFFREMFSSQLFYVLLFVLAFTFTVIHRMGSISDLLFRGGPSEKKVRQEVDLARTYDEAVLAQDSAIYPKAAALYEKVVSGDPQNIQARYNLARIYEKQLNMNARAKMHYRELMGIVSPEHPYYRDAHDALKAEGSGQE